MKIIRKTKIGWVVNDNTVIAFDKNQATCYHIYNAPSHKNFEMLQERVLLSNDNELNSWVDVICLSQEMEIIGYATRIKREWFEQP